MAIDTALSGCSVALLRGGETIAAAYEEIGRGHAERLMPMMEEIMTIARARGHDYDDVGAVAVTVGPGAFTGLRIGLSTARALGLALGRPVVPVTTFEAVAVASLTQDPPRPGTLVAVLHDARRGELYVEWRRFDGLDADGLAVFSESSEAAAVPVADVVLKLPMDVELAVGSGVPLVAAELAARGIGSRSGHAYPDARWIAAIAARTLRSNVELPPARPLYLRAPDAKLPGGLALT